MGTEQIYSPETPLARAPRSLSALDIVRGHDRVRRQRLVRLMALGVAGISLVLLPSVFFPTFDGISCVALLIALAGSASAYLANRWQQVTVAGYLLLGGGTLGIAWVIAGRAIQTGLTTTDLRLYDFFVLPIVLSGVVATRRAPILVGTITGCFTLVSLLLLPHTTELQLYWEGRDPQTLGSVYDVLAIPIVIQGLTALAAWLGADGVRRSLLSATRADELALANDYISRQAQELERQQRQLHDGIVHIQQVHTAFARGNFSARAEITNHQLQSLALSLNILLSHMERLLREQGQRVRIEVAAHELAGALRRARAGAAYVSPAYTGSALDEVLAELAASYRQGTFLGSSSYPGDQRRNMPSSHPEPGATGSSQPPGWPPLSQP